MMRYPEYLSVDYDEDDLKKLNDPDGLDTREIKKLIRMRLEKIETGWKVVARVPEQSEQMPNWEPFYNGKDQLELMKRVIATHLIRSEVLI